MSNKRKRPVQNNIERLRKASGMNRTELAARLGVMPGTVYQWERYGNKPSVESVFRMMEIFGVSLDYLLGRSDA